MVTLNPYIHLQGNAKEALEFYKNALGGEVTVNTFKDSGVPVEPDEENWLMHGQLTMVSGMMLMVADSPASQGPYGVPTGFSISLSGEDEAELKGYWEKLSEGASIIQPLVKADWGDTFGMLTDRFGITWMVNITGPKA